jgi:TPR repeat protein
VSHRSRSRRAGRGLLTALLAAGLADGQAVAAADYNAPLKQAQAALAVGDYARAYPLYLEQARDNPLAQFTLGLFYQNGWGRPRDPATACRWQDKAARGGIPMAQELFGDCLRLGVDGPADPADPAAAAHWYREAVGGGDLGALCTLGEMAMHGEGMPADLAEGIRLCRQAAEKGSVPSQLRLARLYLSPGVNDPEAALQWYRFAASAGSAAAQFELALCLEQGLGQPADPSAARTWMEAAASQGWLPAYLPTAQLYFHAPPDPATQALGAAELAKAYLWASAAARRLDGDGHRDAEALLAQVMEVMPATWRKDLDAKVEAHLHQLAASPPGS